MVDLPLFDHPGQPFAAFRGPLDGQKQGEELGLPLPPGELRQCLGERKVLGLAVGRKTRGIGGQKGEGTFRILAVFRKVEMDASDEIPGRVLRLEKALKRLAGRGHLPLRSLFDGGPEIEENFRGEILSARHGRRTLDQCLEERLIGRGNGNRPVFRGRGQASHIAAPEVAPEGPDGREGRRDLHRSQVQQTLSGSPVEGGNETLQVLCRASFRVHSCRSPRPGRCQKSLVPSCGTERSVF